MNQFIKSPKMRSCRRAVRQGQAKPGCNFGEPADESLCVARLLRQWPTECTDAPGEAGRILRLLMQALRRERALGRAGRCAYDLTRHIALNRACNQARLAAKQKNARPDCGRAPKIHSEGVHAKGIADSSVAAVTRPN